MLLLAERAQLEHVAEHGDPSLGFAVCEQIERRQHRNWARVVCVVEKQ
jgi:hypothetical protein